MARTKLTKTIYSEYRGTGFTVEESIKLWKSGINPNTGRRIKLWGQTWMSIMNNNSWCKYVDIPVINTLTKNNYSKSFIEYHNKL
uniref:Uncharacterized protein n=1 Tax=Pithovirus LCPAC001 TaxID=2506585 RepID=A0A481Z1L2_9VIRU|nr:MAG: hypothetical protein LCPAC001_00530 [Pithovirus LCPAC001]